MKPKIAILTLHPHNYGGVLALQKNVYEFCKKYFEPTLFFLGFGVDISTSIKRCKFSSRVRHTSYFGMQAVEIGARWATWEPAHYTNTLKMWAQELDGYDYFFVASGTPIVAHPLILLNKKFVGIYASDHATDRTQRMAQLKGIRGWIEKKAHPRMLKLEKEILEKTNYLWAMSRYTQHQFQTILQHERQLAICAHPVVDEKIGIIKHHKAADEQIIIAVGRFDDPRKNIAMLFAVFEQLYAVLPHLKLYVIGSVPLPSTVAPYTQKSFFKSVIFTGYVEASALDTFYEQADLMLITSHQEGLGIVGLEALGRGVPVISTKCGGPEDFVFDGVTGYTVEVNDVEAMVRQALLVLTDIQEHERLRRQGPEFIQKNFSVSAIENKYKEGLVAVWPELKDLFFKKVKKA